LGWQLEEVERRLLQIQNGQQVIQDMLREIWQYLTTTDRARLPAGPAPAPSTEEVDLSLERQERRLIEEALQRFRGNRKKAAQALGISERTLYRKIDEYGLHQL
jgi:DNA-binding NtrC family response regulator